MTTPLVLGNKGEKGSRTTSTPFNRDGPEVRREAAHGIRKTTTLAGFIRLEQDSQDGVSWKDRLCLLLEGIGEVCYKKDQIQ